MLYSAIQKSETILKVWHFFLNLEMNKKLLGYEYIYSASDMAFMFIYTGYLMLIFHISF